MPCIRPHRYDRLVHDLELRSAVTSGSRKIFNFLNRFFLLQFEKSFGDDLRCMFRENLLNSICDVPSSLVKRSHGHIITLVDIHFENAWGMVLKLQNFGISSVFFIVTDFWFNCNRFADLEFREILVFLNNDITMVRYSTARSTTQSLRESSD